MDELFSTSLQLMFVGMGVVFCFLLLLVVMIKLLAHLLTKYAPEEQTPPAPAIQTPVANPGSDGAVTAAIGVAVHQYKNKNSK